MSLHGAAAWSLAASCFFMGVATAPMNLFFALALLLTVLSASGRQAIRANLTNPAVMAFVAMFCILLLGSFHGEGNWAESQHYLGKYGKFLLAPIVAGVIASEAQWQRLLNAFGCAMLLTLALSYALWLGGLPAAVTQTLHLGDANNPTVFKLQITQNILMALALFLWLQRARAALRASHQRWLGGLWLAVCALAAFNVLFMVQGRSGYVVLATVGLLLFVQGFRWRGLVPFVLLVGAVSIGGYALSGNFKARVDEVVENASGWSPETSDHAASSSQRLGYWAGAVGVIKAHPLIGAGLGGYQSAFRQANKVKALEGNDNPHQQYLLMWAQLGVFGLAAFIAMQAILWAQAAGRIGQRSGVCPQAASSWAMMVIAGFAAANLFNSLHLDSTESLFYVVMLCAALRARPLHA